MKVSLATLTLISSFLLTTTASVQGVESQVEHGYVKNNGVKIHYASLGTGPLVIMIHGFPDFWYTWRYQMKGLSNHFRTVAVDLRGYNLSDKPKGVDQYSMDILVQDIVSVIRQLSGPVDQKAIVVGHDWGGAIAWSLAMNEPDLVERLVICNLPHLRGLRRELSNNPEQQANSQYARNFQQPDAHNYLTAERLAEWVSNPNDRQKYITAFKRSDFESMLNYYKANYPRPPYTVDLRTPVIKVKCPVLMFHGLDDQALLPSTLNNTWDWIDNELTLVTIPNIGHFIQQEAHQRVTQVMRRWLLESSPSS